ncbi:MAG: ammonium transporter [Nitrospirae bacterium RBG_19FT_COMBO_42_15]|nr:MAG: ammonium transporter [Nitrospirae bacterium RBG_19FT_COMBO_42_15]
MEKMKRMVSIISLIFILLPATLAFAEEPKAPAPAGQEAPAAAAPVPAPAPAAPAWDAKIAADTVWVLITAFLVFFMNLGFAMVESGLCRSKNAVNILSKNVVVFCVTVIFFWFVGFGIMFGNGSPYFGTTGWMLGGADNSPATGDAYKGIFASLNWTGVPLFAKFIFQLVFAGTAATIVSGAVAERIKYFSFFVFSAVMAVIIYPIAGHWIWGGGWLATLKTPFLDFAGSTVVHSIGGWAALTGAILLGPRIGKYTADGKVNAIPGHNMGMATLGMFVLWFGWFGFNPGSTMAADPDAIARVAINTCIAGAVGGVAATFVAYMSLGKPDLSMALNGILAGLVAITASCNWVTPGASFIIGLVGGVLVVYAVLFFDKIKIDDPVGALSVHLVNGIWGTLAVGLFAADIGGVKGLFYGGGAAQLTSQIIGIVSVGVFVIVVSLISWLVIKSIMGLRVEKDEEREGLDIGEHGMEAYPDFVGASSKRS